MATINEDYVSYEVAQLLKEKGFEEWCCLAYGISVRHNGEEIDEDEEYELKVNGKGKEIEYIEGGHLYGMNYNNGKDFSSLYACPTQSLVMKWLREVHNICITIYPVKEKGYEAVLYDIKDDVEIVLQSFGIYGFHIFEDSYKQACEAALKYCLENLI